MALEYFKQIRRAPMLLTPRQFYLLFGVLFMANAVVLAVLIHAVAADRDVFRRIVEEARSARIQASTAAAEAALARPKMNEAASPVPPSPSPLSGKTAVRVALPAGWQWTGCHVDQGTVEVALSPVNAR